MLYREVVIVLIMSDNEFQNLSSVRDDGENGGEPKDRR